MKKVFALLFVAGIISMTSCGKKEEATETTVDSTATVETAPAEPVMADSAAAAPADSAAAAPAAPAAEAPAAH